MSFDFVKDIQYAWRVLRRNRSFTVAVTVSLALAIGPNIALFSIIDQMFFAGSLRYAPDSLFGVRMERRGMHDNLSYPEYRNLYTSNRVFSQLVASERVGGLLRLDGIVDALTVEIASTNYFSILNVHAAVGRLFSPGYDNLSQDAVPAVISYPLWLRRFGGSRDIIGKVVNINGRIVTIIGVAERGFRGTALLATVDLWVPLELWRPTPGVVTTRDDADKFAVMGLLKPGITEAQAGEDLELVSKELDHLNSVSDSGWNMVCWPARSDEMRVHLVLMAIVLGLSGGVLAVACMNVCTLLLARASARRYETATRIAMGANSWQLFRLLLSEGLVLSILAGILGFFLAYLVLLGIPALLPKTMIPFSFKLNVNLNVVMYTLFLTLGTTLLFALAPSRQMASKDISSALRGKTVGFRGAGRLSSFALLIIAQITASQMLLGSAALLLHSYQKVQKVQPGFDVNRKLLLVTVAPDLSERRDGQGISYYDLSGRLEMLPGVKHVSYTDNVPLSIYGEPRNYHISYGTSTGGQLAPVQIPAAAIGPGYFGTMGTVLLAGSEFARQDIKNSNVAVVNRTLARLAFPSISNPVEVIGLTLRSDHGVLRIVGVAEDGKYSDLRETQRPYMYVPASEYSASQMTLLVEMNVKSESISSSVRQVLRSSNLSIVSMTNLREHMHTASYADEMGGFAVGSMGVLSLLLSIVGLIGLTAYSVQHRQREISIRLALGSTRWGVIRHLEFQSVRPVLIGVLLGLVGVAVLGRIIHGLLFGIPAFDLICLVGSALFILFIGIVASVIPTYWGTNVVPVAALRQE